MYSTPPTRLKVLNRMIDREQVLHVARLARLELTGEEVERMSAELSGVLDHIEKIGELDLENVPPDLAPDVGQNSAASRRAAAEPPARGRFRSGPRHPGRRLPRPEPDGARMSEIADLTATELTREITAGHLSQSDVWEPSATTRRRRAQRLHLGRESAATCPTSRSADPVGAKDLFCVRDSPATGLEDRQGLHRVHHHRRHKNPRRRRAAPRQDQPGRVAIGSSTEARVRPDA